MKIIEGQKLWDLNDIEEMLLAIQGGMVYSLNDCFTEFIDDYIDELDSLEVEEIDEEK